MQEIDSNVTGGNSPTCPKLETPNEDDKMRRDKNEESPCDPPLEKGTNGKVNPHARAKYSHVNRREAWRKRKPHGNAPHGDAPPDGKKQKEQNTCVVCLQNGVAKYKFVCCCEGYCSVACFKKHDKEACLEEQRKKASRLNVPNSLDSQNGEHKKGEAEERGDNRKEDDEESEEDLLTEDQKMKLKEDITLRMLLKNNYVRSVFKHLTTSKDKIAYLSNYINDPTIVQVVDQIMKSVEG
ncbi:conserved Plasmodium protein, unknown function [Plasmodium vivax]|uniref:HIT-type domain-containing protein n=6 Tax=Plasmodium vivax TaxID=5855 RepID=A5K6N4_PLAVS|nr:hypothetical protein, conserved [Plasmodium vivax]KMZ81235.1 hypothetical protein PVIIG_04822 [Plasmodium vivax India VII]KMZ87380.1 hypothetical protein PVBG_04089 [Plasmodium vivax Brazil I]KMZ93974.1 hypothetical protein PVMG_03141 [Plasmodium vivax Mauritania I]KNA00370.1 hypothetical protein PVNG_01004 [Plasmodium vivax North Korean]EDL44975.1 hypothetical protein, conserved [Plasmodium vivax]|eukprot:XP_001614702.1 hypothetical protein [Plasmodium vivax Sal-1]